jgi:hypothetical protein
MDRTVFFNGGCREKKPLTAGVCAGLRCLPALVAVITICMCMGSFLSLSLSCAGDLYRWTDESGEVHYSDTPPQETSSPNQKVKSIPIPESQIPEAEKETPQQVKKKSAPARVSAQKDITIYTRDT